MRDRRSWQDKAAGRQARGVLLRVLEERGIAGDIDRVAVAAHAVAVGRRLGLGMRDLDDLIRAAELQDLGKITIPDRILNKSGALAADEWAVVRRHPLVGERILAGAHAMRGVARLVGACYERWDGSGYPNALAGEDIPVGARILAVCVAFSAMTAERAYRAPMTPEEAVTQLRIASGTKFDPVVVDTFCLETEAALAAPALI
jgi:HD-GYP domain-containing protein (c-di-GMP phosphodiesterase class II)